MTTPDSPMAAAIAPLGLPRNQNKKKKKLSFRPVKKAGAKQSKAANSSKELSSSIKSSASSKPSPKQNQTAPKTPTPTKKPPACSKKRKQSTSISVGLVRARDEKRIKTYNAPQEDEGTSSSETPPDRTSAIVVANPESANQDKDILERLRTEDGLRLNTFCSKFKGKKRQPKQNNTHAVPPPKEKNNSQHASKNKRSTAESTGAPAVQIVDGEIVLQESSLVVPGQRRSVQEVEEEFEIVEEDATLGIVGASINSFVNRKGPQHWTVKETERFYEALRQLGTDFGCMEAFFENRTRKQLKRKYQAEQTRNPRLVEMALDPKNQTEIDLSVFNVEVDPKAIEAAANEEPPPYEPTNTGDDTNEGESKSQDQLEEVVEDAEEEKAAAAAAVVAATAATANQQSIWPSFGAEEEHHEPAADFNEPSMADFFPDKEVEETINPPQVTASVAEVEETSISLVPKKAKKTKRPKFRSAARKRK